MGLFSCMWRSTWAISSCDDSAEMKEVLDTLPTSELLSPLQSRAAWGKQDMIEVGRNVFQLMEKGHKITGICFVIRNGDDGP